MATIYHEAEEQFKIENESNKLIIEVETGNGQGGGIIVFFDNINRKIKNRNQTKN